MLTNRKWYRQNMRSLTQFHNLPDSTTTHTQTIPIPIYLPLLSPSPPLHLPPPHTHTTAVALSKSSSVGCSGCDDDGCVVCCSWLGDWVGSLVPFLALPALVLRPPFLPPLEGEGEEVEREGGREGRGGEEKRAGGEREEGEWWKSVTRCQHEYSMVFGYVIYKFYMVFTLTGYCDGCERTRYHNKVSERAQDSNLLCWGTRNVCIQYRLMCMLKCPIETVYKYIHV